MNRVGQNRIYTSYMTAYLVISQPELPYVHRVYMKPSTDRLHDDALPCPTTFAASKPSYIVV